MTYSPHHLWPYPQELALTGAFAAPHAVRIVGESPMLTADLTDICRLRVEQTTTAYPLTLTVNPASGDKPQSYRLTLAPRGAQVVGADDAGLAHGLQTLVQILAESRGSTWPDLAISDWPTHRKRAVMLDLGRSVFSVPFLQRMVRVLARLKLNVLHLHLYDDELCGLRFEGLPFGWENPYAITIADLAELVRYAAQYHVEILPELEGWGHVGFLVHHRPDLLGGEGMYAGASFLIGEQSFGLMRELLRQVVAVMPDRATIHLGLDEAQFFLHRATPADFSPEQLVRRYYRTLMEIGMQQGKSLTMQVWADHAGRPVPPEIQYNVIIQPWQYWNKSLHLMDEAIAKYSGADKKMRWMAGAGQSVSEFRGAYHATRYWCRRAAGSSNCEGVDITLWGANDIQQQMISLFAGAYYAWNPESPTPFAGAEEYEDFDRQVFPRMYRWQATFPDAYPDDLLRERGPLVVMGHYLWGDRHALPVAPTVAAAKTTLGHEYLVTPRPAAPA